jgi:ribosome-associated heat shock protein Hsp15
MLQRSIVEKGIGMTEIRLDKWLWAARFYKTRNLAREALDGGKVQIDGVKAKPSKIVQIGMKITLRQGFDNKTIVVKALTEQRKGAAEAALLYEETQDSIAEREKMQLIRKSMPSIETHERPNKKQRREILKFKRF